MNDEPRPSPKNQEEPPQYTAYRSRPRYLAFLDRRAKSDPAAELQSLRADSNDVKSRRKRWTLRRVIKWFVLIIGGWLALSFVLFMASAQFKQEQVSPAAKLALDSAGPMPFVANTILVLGSDARPAGSKEGGADPGGPSRSDTIMLIRSGGGKSARLSIPRDTVVDIPGNGANKINAAYAFGGAALAITTVKRYLGIKINHVIEVNFDNFPGFINALGGVTVKTGCVTSNINGGKANGGFTLELKAGQHHLDGDQALAFARTRKNECNPAEDDITRAQRQQAVLAGIKGQMLTPGTFLRLPWVAWKAPQTIRSDMHGPGLLGLFAAIATGGSPPTRVLKPTGFETLPDGGAGLTVSEESRQTEVKRFLDG
ncbi:MAG: LCP family protein [Solirubrobacterales bacterium]|nr:LCP family protein [Solirubrobacterales bacterium]